MADLSTRVFDLYNSLDEFKATDKPGAAVANMYDAIVEAAQAVLPDDPVLRTVRTGRRTSIGSVIDTAGDMRTVLQQILSAMDQTGPSIG